VPSARCAIFKGANQPFELADLPLPKCGPGDVLVEISLATICASDLHTADGRRIEPCPSVLGHEGVGRVVALGEKRDRALLGQRVTWTIADSCGDVLHALTLHLSKLTQANGCAFPSGHKSRKLRMANRRRTNQIPNNQTPKASSFVILISFSYWSRLTPLASAAQLLYCPRLN